MSRARMYRPDYELDGPYPAAPEVGTLDWFLQWITRVLIVLVPAACAFVACVVSRYLGWP